jgi:hypothetical protein
MFRINTSHAINEIYNFENYMTPYILWPTGLFPGNDHETNTKTMAVTRQRPASNNGSTVGGGVFYVVRSEVAISNLISFEGYYYLRSYAVEPGRRFGETY